MCYAIPGKVVEIKKNIALIDYYGEKRKVLNENREVRIGDYIYAQGGIILNKIPEKEALEILDFWREKFQELKKIDKKISKINKTESSENLLKILQRVNKNQELTKEEMSYILNINNENELKLLYETANNQRQKHNDNACCVHGIIEFSNYCKNNCHYCGIRRDSKVERYRMSPEEIIKTAENAVKNLGFKALVLQSGEDFYYDEEKLTQIVKELKKLEILIFLSIGVRSKKTYANLYEAGARAILMRFETSNKELFEKLRPETNFEERISLIKYLKEIGYVVATGFLIGLPNETENDAINNILLTKKLDADMYSLGPFIPCIGTPLEKSSLVNKDKVLKIIALSRLTNLDAKILVTTALETLDKKTKKLGLLSGGNSLMINVTPKKYKELYSIYPNKAGTKNEVEEEIKSTLDLLYSLGRAPTDLGI
ncbi:MAG: [FeFe] hydrogenase H-cluster radical SAM maturase HydE [Nanoarchaeota archaeon]